MFASKKFFKVVVALLIVQAAWIAITSKYPMAFDEDFHFGIIKLYSHHWLPFWSGQPPNANQFGAVWRDPSYLYQYLMSWPYRLINLFTSSQYVQVLFLRLINVALAAWSVVLFRKVLTRTKVSDSAANIMMLIYVLIPVVTMLSAQINYDNLMLVMTPACILLALKVYDKMKANRIIDAPTLLILASLCMLGSLVKYPFLPIAVALPLWLIFIAWHYRMHPVKIWASFAKSFRSLKLPVQVALVFLVIISAGLFAERYGVNAIKYHDALPSCDKVLDVDACVSYGPWDRVHQNTLANAGRTDINKSPILFVGTWLRGMWYRMFFAVAGSSNNFSTKGPLPIPAFGSLLILIISVVATVRIAIKKGVRKIYKEPVIIILFATITVLYVASLFIQNYMAFRGSGQTQALNGRYLFPVLPLLMAAIVLPFDSLVKGHKRNIMMIAVIVIMAWGGGALTYIIRADDGWYYQNHAVLDINHVIQNVASPITPGSNHPDWFRYN